MLRQRPLVFIMFLIISLALITPTILRMALIDPDKPIGQIGERTITNNDFLTLFSLFAATISVVGFFVLTIGVFASAAGVALVVINELSPWGGAIPEFLISLGASVCYSLVGLTLFRRASLRVA